MAVADPTSDPVAGKVPVGSDITLATATASCDVHYTVDGSTPSADSPVFDAGDLDGLLDASGNNLTVKAIGIDPTETEPPSAVVTFTFNAVGYSAAVDATTPALLDTNTTQGLGSACAGIGLVGADAASAGVSRIGGAAGTDVKYETNV